MQICPNTLVTVVFLALFTAQGPLLFMRYTAQNAEYKGGVVLHNSPAYPPTQVGPLPTHSAGAAGKLSIDLTPFSKTIGGK